MDTILKYVFILLLFCGLAGATPQLIQQASNNGTGSTLTITFPSTTINGDVVFCFAENHTFNVSSVTGAGGGTWTQAKHSATHNVNDIWTSQAVSSGTTSVTITYAGAASNAGLCAEYSGVTTTTDGSASANSGSNTNPTTGAFTPGTAGDLVLASSSSNGTTVTAGPANGYAEIGSSTGIGGGSGDRLTAAYLIYASGSTTTNWTVTSSSGWDANAIAYKATATTSNTWFASPSGSGTACTSSSPCSLAQAGTNAGPGDTVQAACGTYTSTQNMTNNGVFQGNIVYTSANVSTHCAVLAPTSGAFIWVQQGNYSTITGFTFDGSSGGGTQGGISSDDHTPSIGTHDLFITDNILHDTSNACNTTGGAVIKMNGNADGGGFTIGNNLITKNLIYHNDCGQTGSTPSTSGQHGIYSQLANDTIQNNVIVDHGGGWCIQAYHAVTNWTVTNNTMAACAQGGIVISDANANVPANTTVTNNVIVNSGNTASQHGGIFESQCGGTNNVVQNNLMYGNLPSNYVGSATCGATNGNTQSGSNSTTFNNYTGTGAGDYTLKAGSTGFGNGTTTCATGFSPCVPVLDKNGFTRPNPPAIGAYDVETGGTGINPPKLTCLGVGP